MTGTRPVVALGTRLRRRVLDALAEDYTVVPTEAPLTAETVAPEAAAARALVTLGILPLDGMLMDALPQLGLIACYGSGYEGVDRDAALDRGIAVTHSPGGNAASVADLAMALVLATSRRVVAADAYVRSGAWRRHPSPDLPVLPGLTGRRLGIFGLGEVGRRVADRAAAFEMEVGYHGRVPRDTALPYFPTLTALAEWADVLVITARATPDNHEAVGAAILRALGPTGHLVNVARGSLVDEAALAAALREGAIAGAALDVYAAEPMAGGELLDAPNLVLSPHVAGATETAERAAIDMVRANLAAFFAGRRPLPNEIPSTPR